MPLTIATVNVNGIRAAVKKRHEDNLGMLPWLEETSADVVLLQEVRSTDDQARAALAPALEAGWHWVGAENALAKGRAGVGILSRAELDDVRVGFGSDEFDRMGRYISGVLRAADSGIAEDVRIASLYLPSGSAKTAEVPQLSSFGSRMKTTPLSASSRQVAFTSSATKEMPVKVPMRSSWPSGVKSTMPEPVRPTPSGRRSRPRHH